MYAVEMLKVTKIFGNFKANDAIDLRVRTGEIHALLGENGAGKSTLMNLLFGFYELDGGVIKINNKEVVIKNPNVANDLKIGMVHQHFKLVKPFTVTQNITLGNEPTKKGVLDYTESSQKVQDLIDKYNFKIDANAKVSSLTVGQQQKVEILKMLYKESEVLIFDEPTGALTPQETTELLDIILKLKKENKTVILITHKLNEIKSVCDRCTVIRRGKSIDTVDVAKTSEEQLAELMVGRSVNFNVSIEEIKDKPLVMQISDLSVIANDGVVEVDNVSLDIFKGEILGIAGVDGNGQIPMMEAITGIKKVNSGSIKLVKDEQMTDITNLNIRTINEHKIGHIPQDRQKYGVVLDYNVGENAVLKRYFKSPFTKNKLLNTSEIEKYGDSLIALNDIRTPHGVKSSLRDMSGGNQQKLIIAREIAESPEVLLAVQPTRGVDIGAIEFIHEQLLEQRRNSKAIVLVSLELEEIIKLSDRVAVMHDGKLMGVVPRAKVTEELIGLMMAGKEYHEE